MSQNVAHEINIEETPLDRDPALNGDAPSTPRVDTFGLNHLNDVGNSKRLVALHGKDLRYAHAMKKWYRYDGKLWSIDDIGEVERRAKHTVRSLYVAAAKAEEVKTQRELSEFAGKCSSVGKITAMIQLAKSEPGIPIRPNEFDPDPMKFNCQNGTIDLADGGKLLPHRRADLITKVSPVVYDPTASADAWEEFLAGVFDDNEELIAFIWRLFGYCLTGKVTEQILPVFWGSGSNGKSTLLEAFMAAIGGDYSMKAPAGFMMATKADRHPTEVADLFGKRFVVATETEENRRIAESMVKELTGGDTLRARRMKEDFWQFQPSHKIILCTNHRPTIKGNDHSIWRRICLVPFEQRFWNPDRGERGAENRRQDKDLPKKLEAERAGILAWAVRGCIEWQENGLQIPDIVREATGEYRSSEDVFGQFIAERCFEDNVVCVKAGDIYRAYRKWCEDNGERSMRQNEFGKRLKERGFEDRKGAKGVRQWYGIALNSDAFDGD